MNSKLVISASALFMGAIGIGLSFASSEILASIGQEPSPVLVLIMQVTGALYFGFAMLNWMAKSILIGGIYARPVSIGNFCHFGIAALALVKSWVSTADFPYYLILLTGIYGKFALLFAYIFVSNPFKSQA